MPTNTLNKSFLELPRKDKEQLNSAEKIPESLPRFSQALSSSALILAELESTMRVV